MGKINGFTVMSKKGRLEPKGNRETGVVTTIMP
jgi:hypothetical protein